MLTVLFFIVLWFVVGAASHVGSVLLEKGEYCGKNVTDSMLLSLLGPLCTVMVVAELVGDRISNWRYQNRHKVLISIKRKGDEV